MIGKHSGCGRFGDLARFSRFIDAAVTEEDFLLTNGLREVIGFLPLFEQYLGNSARLLTIKAIPTRSHEILCGILSTQHLRDMGRYVYDISSIFGAIKNMVWIFIIYFIVWVLLYVRKILGKKVFYFGEEATWFVYIINTLFAAMFVVYCIQFLYIKNEELAKDLALVKELIESECFLDD
jgi:hypothetical protein